jgi:hypothetical protein
MTVGEPIELDQLEQRAHLALDLRIRKTQLARPHAQAKCDIFEDRHVCEQRVVLEHKADLSLPRMAVRRVGAVKGHRARVRRLEARDDSQERRLARTRRTEQREKLPGLDFEIDAVQRHEGSEAFGDARQRDAHTGAPSRGSRTR